MLAGNIRAIARAATIIENDRVSGQAILSRLFPFSGRAQLLGITGPAGTGKSTLVNTCIRHLRAQGKRVAVVAIDPTSAISRGALLGDRIRMVEHWGDPGVFIRSVATRGQLGGIAAASLGMCLLLDAAGFDFIFVETIGVGQDEVDIAALAQVTALVLMPGAGDDVQAVKAGIMEVADIFLINKADLPGTERLHDELQFAQSLGTESIHKPICRVSALNGAGVDEFMNTLPPLFEQQTTLQMSELRWREILSRLVEEQAIATLPPSSLAREASAVRGHLTDPYSAASRLLSEISVKDN